MNKLVYYMSKISNSFTPLKIRLLNVDSVPTAMTSWSKKGESAD